jgi:peptidoglycan-associated lipoprotein
MNNKALWGGLVALGVGNWLTINLVVGPAYLASADSLASVEGAEQKPAARPATPTPPREAPPLSGLPPAEPSPTLDLQPPIPAEAPEPAPTTTATSLEPPKTAAQDTQAAPPALEPLLFSRQSAELSADSRRALQKAATFLMSHPNATVLIEGHADERGADEFNHWLSQQRARSARSYLHALGVKPEQMQVESFGSTQPVDTSKTEAACAVNRRVVLTVRNSP